MTRVVLERTGDRPLSVVAEKVDSWSTLDIAHDEPRWHTLTLWRTADGMWAVQAGYHSSWRSELPHYDAAVLTSRRVADWLTLIDPVAHVIAWRGMKGREGMQDRLLVTLTQRWDAMVSMALDRPEFREEVQRHGG